MKDMWHKIVTFVRSGDFALACSVVCALAAMYYFEFGEPDRWKDFVICSFGWMLAAYTCKVQKLRDKINDLNRQLIEAKRGRYDQIALERLRERNG